MPAIDFAERLERLAPYAYPDGLRPSQAHVLNRFAELQTTASDIGVELPTGEGKTLIGLLIADWALDDGMSVAYLTGTKQLAEQVMEQAGSLEDLLAHRFEGRNYPGDALDDYHQAHAVGVMNYWVYFNSSPRVEPADLVIFDDAHLAEQPLGGMFTVSVSARARRLYEALCDVVLQHAPDAYPTLKAMRDGSAPPGSPPELIAFNDWAAVAESVAETIRNSPFLESSDVRYVWPTVEPNLGRCGALIGPAAIEIRPYHPPTQTVPGYARSRLRVYLSATLGQPGDLQRRLGTHHIDTIETPLELCTATTGRRTFLLNPGPGRALDDDAFGFALDQLAHADDDGPGRAAWLCASNDEADQIQGLLAHEGRTVYRLGQQADDRPFEQWRTTPGAQLVTAGRFDGLDMPDDTCRLVVIPSVPAASSAFERFAVAYLGDASFMRHRIGQRVTQALGRANRTANDSALYLGLDPSFSATLANSAVRSSIGPEVAGAVRNALVLHGEGWSAVKRAADEFWATHHDTDGHEAEGATRRRPGRSRPGRSQSASVTADSADDEVSAVTRFWLGDHEAAAQRALAAAEKLAQVGEPEHSAFWCYVAAHIFYDSGLSSSVPEARRRVEEAVAAAPSTPWFVRLRRTARSLAGAAPDPTSHDALYLVWDEWIRETGGRLPARIAEARAYLTGTHDQRADGLLVLARLCGVEAERPRGQSVTDVRWTWATPRKGHRRVWEVKTGTSGPVCRDDVDQLLGQVAEERNRHPRAKVIGCLLAAVEDVEGEAADAAREDVALLHAESALVLFDHLAEIFESYRTMYGAGAAEERGMARDETERRLPVGHDWLARLLAPTGGRLRRAQDFRNALQVGAARAGH